MFSDDIQIRTIQEESLTALKYFHSLCMKHDIHYSVHAGTMLGAVREKGFIPWDDDVDLTMTRAEFKKWEALMETEELDEYFYYDCTTFYNTRLCLQRPGKPLVWLTIFVYDYISEKKSLQKLKLALIAYYSIQLHAHEKEPVESQAQGVKALIIAAIVQSGKLRKKDAIMRSLNRVREYRLTGNKQYMHRANDRFAGVKLILPVHVMERYEIVPFEDTEVMLTASAHEIMVQSYGADYMVPKRDLSKGELHDSIRNKLTNQKERSDSV